MRSSRGRLRRALRIAVIAILIFILLPYVLTPLYLVVRPVSTPMLWRYLTGQPVTRIYRPLGDIAPVLPRTVIASEDARFCAHRGVDWRGLRELLNDAEDMDDLRGGSTITQQTAKNLFLWSGRSYIRKALELPLEPLDRPHPRQAPGHGNLPEYRRMGPERPIRGRGRQPQGLQQAGQRTDRP